MGITRDSRHKRRNTGGKRHMKKKKRKFELGRPGANTKLGEKRIHTVRCRGGNLKFRGIRMDTGNFTWGSEVCTRKTRIVDVVYNASNNELVRTKTLVKNTIVIIDATPFKQWYEAHYGVVLGKKKKAKKKAGEAEADEAAKPKSKSVLAKLAKRQKGRVIEEALEEQLANGRVLACISSRPGQCGRCDGYLLEAKEYEFYSKQYVCRDAFPLLAAAWEMRPTPGFKRAVPALSTLQTLTPLVAPRVYAGSRRRRGSRLIPLCGGGISGPSVVLTFDIFLNLPRRPVTNRVTLRCVCMKANAPTTFHEVQHFTARLQIPTCPFSIC